MIIYEITLASGRRVWVESFIEHAGARSLRGNPAATVAAIEHADYPASCYRLDAAHALSKGHTRDMWINQEYVESIERLEID